ncbi:conserved hypothetical protein [Gammaproteobacteria bacterium]
MKLSYLAEYADAARIALDLADRELSHLRYTHTTLYAEPIDLNWVSLLSKREDLSEKIDAFMGRFGRLQDHLGEKLLPAFARLVGGQPKSLLDVLTFSERMGWIESAEEFVSTRKLRNLLVHEYMIQPDIFLETLLSAKAATELLFRIVANIQQEAVACGLVPSVS